MRPWLHGAFGPAASLLCSLFLCFFLDTSTLTVAGRKAVTSTIIFCSAPVLPDGDPRVVLPPSLGAPYLHHFLAYQEDPPTLAPGLWDLTPHRHYCRVEFHALDHDKPRSQPRGHKSQHSPHIIDGAVTVDIDQADKSIPWHSLNLLRRQHGWS
jgi:hypothetical protein